MKRPLLLAAISLARLPRGLSQCPNNCNGHGTCEIFGRCQCSSGFQGADCSGRTCALGLAWADLPSGTDQAHALAECSNRGICDLTSGECVCSAGFVGEACDRLACPSDCNGQGRCLSLRSLAAFRRNFQSQQFVYDSVWDADKVQGCVCDLGFYGTDCSLRACPVGDDPLTTGQVNDVQLLRCLSSAGSFVLYFGGLPTAWIPYSASVSALTSALNQHPLITQVSVTYSPGYASVCATTSNVVRIEFMQDFGALPPLVPSTDVAMQNVGGTVVVSADGHTPLTDSAGNVYESVVGTKESAPCSNRGICDPTSGICSCFNSNGDAYDTSNGYGGPGQRGDCGWVRSSSTGVVSSCPSTIQCSGHGTCNGTALIEGMPGSYTCVCEEGWTAGDCSLRTCPLGLSWFDYPSANNVAHVTYSPCSDMGICDPSNGQCACAANFFGAACEYMNCPGDPGYTCSGHGQCLSMSQLAQVATVNGDLGGFTYGSDPNNHNTWDAERVMGCFCDSGFGGYDCSLRLCPTGDDPGTYEDHWEVQLFQCVATSGFFTLSFREQTTAPIAANGTTAAELKSILSSISTLSYGNISVYFSENGRPPNSTFFIYPPELPNYNQSQYFFNQSVLATASPTANSYNTTVCDPSGKQIVIIEFVGIPSALPPLQADTTLLQDYINSNGFDGSGTIRIFTGGQSVDGFISVTGTTENDICNNRGLCDFETGRCECFRDWGSSDGNGNMGGRGDCGWRRNGANSILPPP